MKTLNMVVSRAARQARRLALMDEAGAAAVEFGLGLPVLLLALVGILELCGVVYAQASIHHAAREIARFASVNGAASAIPTSLAVLEAMAEDAALLPPDTVTAAASWSPDNMPGSIVNVSVTHTFTPFTSIIFDLRSFPLTASTSLTIVR